MALGRIGGFVQGYNAYNIPAVGDKTNLGSGSVQDQGVKDQPKEETKQQEEGIDLTVEVSDRDNASIENVAISFGLYDGISFDLFGSNGLASDNMKDAINGMQKDQLLHQYQYFVGGKDMTGKESKIIAGTEDGLVIKLD